MEPSVVGKYYRYDRFFIYNVTIGQQLLSHFFFLLDIESQRFQFVDIEFLAKSSCHIEVP